MLSLSKRNVSLKKRLSAEAAVLEGVIKGLGMSVRVVEIETLEKYTDFFLDIAVGVKLSDLLECDRDIAMALASATGKVEILAPVPGRPLVRIRVPVSGKAKTSDQKYKVIRIKESVSKEEKKEDNWIYWIFRLTGLLFAWVSRKLLDVVNRK